jgi:hypothetical protein
MFPDGHPHWKVLPACLCKQCEDARALCGCGQCGGHHCAACKQQAVDTTIYKMRLRDLSSTDTRTRELAKSSLGGEEYLRKGAVSTRLPCPPDSRRTTPHAWPPSSASGPKATSAGPVPGARAD